MFFDFLFKRHDRKSITLLAVREIKSRVVGTFLGPLHYFLVPILMLLIYTFVFSMIFSIRWQNVEAGFGSFALRLFAGLVPFQFFAEVINRAPGLVMENPSYVKKVVFPLETLVPMTIVISLFTASISFFVFLLGYLLIEGMFPVTSLWILVLWPPLILLTAGFAWAIAALGVYLRDLRQLVTVLTSVLMFLTPIFYPLSMVPAPYDIIILLNPLSLLIEMMRDALFESKAADMQTVVLYYVFSAVIAQAGYWFFVRTQKGFADVL